jgi:hypothetical protein
MKLKGNFRDLDEKLKEMKRIEKRLTSWRRCDRHYLCRFLKGLNTNYYVVAYYFALVVRRICWKNHQMGARPTWQP